MFIMLLKNNHYASATYSYVLYWYFNCFVITFSYKLCGPQERWFLQRLTQLPARRFVLSIQLLRVGSILQAAESIMDFVSGELETKWNARSARQRHIFLYIPEENLLLPPSIVRHSGMPSLALLLLKRLILIFSAFFSLIGRGSGREILKSAVLPSRRSAAYILGSEQHRCFLVCLSTGQ